VLEARSKEVGTRSVLRRTPVEAFTQQGESP